MDTPKHILIILLGAIGDVVRGLAVAEQIKSSWPDTKITWAVEPISKSLVEAHPAIDNVVVFERQQKLPGYFRFVKKLRKHSYDVCLDLQRHLKSGVTCRLSKAPIRIGFDRGNSREGNWLFQTKLIAPQVRNSPKIDQFMAFCDALGIKRSEKIEFGLQATAEQLDKIDQLMPLAPEARGQGCLLVGSTWESRIWELSYYSQLASELWERWRLSSVIVGGPGDQARADKILGDKPPEYISSLVGKTSLRDLVAVYQRSLLAIGSDSGPMHIAAACNVPIVSLWGATSPIRSGPFGWSRYNLQSAIGCAPCYRKKCPGLGNLCMKTLTPQVVVMQVQRLFDEVEVLK